MPVDFKPGTRFQVSGHEGLHPVHDTVVKTYRHLNLFQHEASAANRDAPAALSQISVFDAHCARVFVDCPEALLLGRSSCFASKSLPFGSRTLPFGG